MRRFCRLLQARKPGQGIVEFALVLPLLLVLIIGLIDGFQWVMVINSVQQATRTAAHQAALIGGYDGDDGVVAESARNALLGNAGGIARVDSVQITGTCANSPCRRYDPITVSLSYSTPLWLPFPYMSTCTAHSTLTRAAEQDQQTGS